MIVFPQRLALPARHGQLLKRPLGLHAPAPRRGERDDDYVAMVRQCPCICCGLDPCGEAAHIRQSSGAHGKRSTLGKTPSDQWILPLDGRCHREDNDALHRVGEAVFFERLGLNAPLICERLDAKRGDVPAMRAVIFNAMAERESVFQLRGIACVKDCRP